MIMIVHRENLKLFIRDLRITAMADEFELTDEILVKQLAEYFEQNEDAFYKPKSLGPQLENDETETHYE